MNLISIANKYNTKFAIIITNGVSTMWCAYLFTAIALISLPASLQMGVYAIISWIAQTFLQLVLLSVIMVGQNILSNKSEIRAEEDHNTLLEELQELKEMHAELHTLVTKLDTGAPGRNRTDTPCGTGF